MMTMDKEQNLSGLKLVELIVLAKTVEFPFTNLDLNNIQKWSQPDLYDAAVSVVVSNNILVHASLKVCNTFSPLKLLFKTTIRNYIKKYSK
jgi:hypothetical protein